MKINFCTIFIALVCVVSLIALGPLTSWGGDETPNPWAAPDLDPWAAPDLDRWTPPDLNLIWPPPENPVSDNLSTHHPHHNFHRPTVINRPPANSLFDNHRLF